MSAPAVSIVLPTDPDVAVTLRCLQALARLPDEPAFEVVLVVPESDVANRGLVEGLEGDVQVVLGEGFDPGAAVAGAGTLVALTATAAPADGWLAELVGALETAPDAVAALPRSLTPEGVDLPEAMWLALAARTEAYTSVGGFAATRAHGQAEKATLLGALRGRGAVVAAPAAVLLSS